MVIEEEEKQAHEPQPDNVVRGVVASVEFHIEQNFNARPGIIMSEQDVVGDRLIGGIQLDGFDLQQIRYASH